MQYTVIIKVEALLDMQKIILIISLISILYSCGHANSNVAITDTVKFTNKQTSVLEEKNPIEVLIKKYISTSKSELVALNRTQEEWIFDRIEKTDTINYLVYQIGHEVADEGNTNVRFITDQWIYIDSSRSQLYEYDLPNDSLVEWRN